MDRGPVPSMDRLSCLPDEVICHILSFLRTKHSVKTSVLSKRWRFLWAHVPVLEFHVDDRLNSEIVDKIVMRHKHDVHTFHLDIIRYIDGSEEEFREWIVNITTCNIRNLFISLDYKFLLPQCLFTCKTLVDLFLSYCGVIPVSGLYFPALKKLKLHSVEYESHESLAHLISGCPVLEELSIVDMDDHLEQLDYCCISSPTLTRLVLGLGIGEYSDFGLKLDTPALRYLKLSCFISDNISVGALDSLIEADIGFWMAEDQRDDFIFWRNVLAFVRKLYNVKFLTLTTDEIAEMRDFQFSALDNKFPNLIKLNLCLSSDFGFITRFLENANNLQVLCLVIIQSVVITFWNEGGMYNQYGWMEPERVPAWLIYHLQTLKVLYFGCSMEEIDMVGYILMNAKVLKRMEIRTWLPKHDPEKKLEALKRIALFNRGSQECQLVFD